MKQLPGACVDFPQLPNRNVRIYRSDLAAGGVELGLVRWGLTGFVRLGAMAFQQKPLSREGQGLGSNLRSLRILREILGLGNGCFCGSRTPS